MKQISYEYKNLPIPGGGYVTGFLFHPKKKELLYARTDIGGTYRYDYSAKKWKSLISHVTMEDLSETYPISLALDENRPNMLYIACGMNEEKSGVLAISEDYGENFRYERIPVRIHGNLPGRGTGERLIVDCDDANCLYFASQQDGFWISKNAGRDWIKSEELMEQHLTFVGQIGKALVVGTAGVTTRVSDTMRGHSLYVSYDKGLTFVPLAEPESQEIEGCKLNGLVAQRYDFDGTYLYVTFASTGRRSYIIEDGYSCDSGDTIDGHIMRYIVEKDGTIQLFDEITPERISPVDSNPRNEHSKIMDDREIRLDYGFSGICASRQTPGMLVATTMVKDDGDGVYRSYDYGKTWECVLYDLEVGELEFRAPYMRPECNGGHSLLHWMSDIKLNPFDEKELWFNSGTGVFTSKDSKADICKFMDWCDGIEETVHLNVYAPSKGNVKVIDILGDLGGFAFEKLDIPPANSFADDNGNRYITCINADYSEEHPECLVVTPRGNWTGKTKGGLILSKDQGKTFERLPMPFGLSQELDEALHFIEQPNVNSGWVAMSPDCKNIVWSVADMISLPVSRMIVSQDGGQTFERCQVYDLSGQKKETGGVKVFSDRVDSNLFYGFGDYSDFYISKDGGKTFQEHTIVADFNFPKTNFAMIDCADRTEVRGVSGQRGTFYLAMGEHGLWKMTYETEEDQLFLQKLSKDGEYVFRVGLGLGREGGNYEKESKALYCNAVIEDAYGFYRSLDEAQTWERINTEKQMYGDINSIDGDKREFGRFYIATGSVGVLYGEPVKAQDEV